MTVWPMFIKDFMFRYFLTLILFSDTFKILVDITLMFECPGVQVWLLLAAEVVLFVYFHKRNEIQVILLSVFHFPVLLIACQCQSNLR